MPTYYDVLGVAADAPQEEIDRACERTVQRLKQSGQYEQYQDQLRKIKETLLTPDLREGYNRRMALNLGQDTWGLPPPANRPRPQVPPPEAAPKETAAAAPARPRRPLLMGLGVAAVLAALYGGWLLYQGMSAHADEGVYLLNPVNGEPVAVILAKDPAHAFPGNSKPSPGVLVYMLASRRAAWLGEAIVNLQFNQGEPAPEEVLKQCREEAKGQDLHQSLR